MPFVYNIVSFGEMILAEILHRAVQVVCLLFTLRNTTSAHATTSWPATRFKKRVFESQYVSDLFKNTETGSSPLILHINQEWVAPGCGE